MWNWWHKQKTMNSRFLYQSVYTSYCAAYAVANLLRLHGVIIQKNTALKQFGFTRNHKPIVTHQQIKTVLNNYFKTSNLIWNSYGRFSYRNAVESLENLFLQNIPTLITFTAIHPIWKDNGVHCAIALDANNKGIHLLDSLGKRKKAPNAIISPKRIKNVWEIKGAPIALTCGKFHILDGLPPIGWQDHAW